MCLQLLHLVTLRRLVGPHRLTSLDSNLSYVPFLHLLPALQHLKLDANTAWATEQRLTRLDLGSLVASESLRVLEIDAGEAELEYLDQLTQLRNLVLLDPLVPAGMSAACDNFPRSLTRLKLQMSEWDAHTEDSEFMPALAGPALQAFQGQLQSLTLDPPFAGELDSSQLSALPCLQQVTHLKLGSGMDTRLGGRLALGSLQFLRLEMIDWPAGQYPQGLDLTSCSKLQSLSLSFLRGMDNEAQTLDIRGITGCRAATLDLRLNLDHHMRASADFSGWKLKTVHITCGTHNGRWRAEQSVRDLIGALANCLPMRKILVDGKRLA